VYSGLRWFSCSPIAATSLVLFAAVLLFITCKAECIYNLQARMQWLHPINQSLVDRCITVERRRAIPARLLAQTLIHDSSRVVPTKAGIGVVPGRGLLVWLRHSGFYVQPRDWCNKETCCGWLSVLIEFGKIDQYSTPYTKQSTLRSISPEAGKQNWLILVPSAKMHQRYLL
jgi:hypothetical protein